MPQSLSQVAFAGSAWTDDENTDPLRHEPAGAKLHDQRAVDERVKREVELFDRLLVAEVGPSECRFELLLVPAGDFVCDDEGKKLHVGEFSLDGLSVSGIQAVQDTGEPKLL